MKKKHIAPILIIFLIGMSTAFSFYYYKIRNEIQQPALAYYGENAGSNIRPFQLLNQEGDTVTEQDLKNKILIVEFFFTRCQGICPTMNENMAVVYESTRNLNDVVILSHSCDPEYDSVGVMKDYSMKYNADPKHWMFLTGDKKTLYDMALYSYLIGNEENEGKPLDEQFVHSSNFVIVDKKGRLRAGKTAAGDTKPYDGLDTADVSRLIADVQKLSENE